MSARRWLVLVLIVFAVAMLWGACADLLARTGPGGVEVVPTCFAGCEPAPPGP